MKKPSVVFSLLAMAMVFHFQGAVQAQTETAKKKDEEKVKPGQPSKAPPDMSEQEKNKDEEKNSESPVEAKEDSPSDYMRDNYTGKEDAKAETDDNTGKAIDKEKEYRIDDGARESDQGESSQKKQERDSKSGIQLPVINEIKVNSPQIQLPAVSSSAPGTQIPETPNVDQPHIPSLQSKPLQVNIPQVKIPVVGSNRPAGR